MYYSTEKEMEMLDELAVRGGLEIRQMMELAGWHMILLFRILEIPLSALVCIVVGNGNKGGDGLSAARHLANYGWNVSVVLVSGDITDNSWHHLNLVRQMQIPTVLYEEDKAIASKMIKDGDILIDSLIGYHLDGAPYGVFAEIIEIMNKTQKKIIAYDIPTGINATSGECFSPCISAFATLTLALPKRAFQNRDKNAFIFGKVFIADLGIPRYLYDKIAENSRPHFERSADGLILLN